MSEGPTLLVVDDEPLVLRTLGVALPRFGFSVRLAGGGHEAVEIFCRHPRAIDLVLLDVFLPDPDGVRILAALRQADSAVRRCCMTGRPDLYSEECLLGLGAVHVFEKPLPRLPELAYQS
jgi:CheY-like chemotaxis protein